jgi:alcohol dehydrogenase
MHSAIPFDYQPRTRLVFGVGTIDQLGRIAVETPIRRALIVTDPGIVSAGHVDRGLASLREAGVEAVVFDGVRENPTTVDVDACLSVARDAKIDGIIGLGGGSAMDTAKGCNFLLTNGGRMQDYWGVGKATRPMLPMIAIPTTAGTGSECQSFALIADEATHQKMACGDPKAAARAAILDPSLTLSQPASVTACTGIDALAHALETAVTKRRNAISALYSKEAFRLIVHSLPIVLRDPSDLEARSNMLLGAAFAGTAIENSMLGAAHSAANPLTAHFGTVHGQAVGIMLPGVVRFNSKDEDAAALYSEWARYAGLVDEKRNGRDPIHAVCEAVREPLELAGLHWLSDEVEPRGADLAVLAEEAARQWTANFNPRPITAADFEELYQEALFETIQEDVKA